MPKIKIEDILDGIFIDTDIKIIDGISSLDIETLRSMGRVECFTEEKDGIVTDTLLFTEPTGLHSFKRVSSYNKNDKLYATVQEINRQIAIAADSENYEFAAILKHKKENLLFNNENK